MQAIRGIAGSIGLLGLLYLTGYVIESSFHDLLGVVIVDPANRLYLASAANFLLDVWRQLLLGSTDLLQALQEIPGPASGVSSTLRSHALFVAVMTTTAVYIGRSRLRSLMERTCALGRRLKGASGPRALLLFGVLFTAGTLAKITYFELPLANLQQLLLQNAEIPNSSPTAPWLARRRAHLETNLICSHATADMEKIAGCQREEGKKHLRSEFLGNVAATMLLIVTGTLALCILGSP